MAPSWACCALLVAVAACAGNRAAPADAGAPDGRSDAADPGSDAGDPGVRAETVWLDGVGRGPTQTARVCARGAHDPVATRLCRAPAPAVHGLAELYQALGLDAPAGRTRLVAATAGSLGLAGRAVSGVNPRVFVGVVPANVGDPQEIAIAAFARGEQFAEMVGYDPDARALNFYLLRFEQPCNTTRCTPADLLTARIEEGWSGWTLYGAEDVTNTGLDCLSCHRPEGPGAPTRFLMRQISEPWLQWTGGLTDDRQVQLDCPGGDSMDVNLPDLVAPLKVIGGSHYGGLAVDEIQRAPSGHELASLLGIAAARMGYQIFDAPVLEPHRFDSRKVLVDRYCRGGSTATWQAYRAEMIPHGLVVPYHDFDVLDAGRTAQATADFGRFLGEHADSDPFLLAAGLMNEDAARAIGFLPSAQDSDDEIIRQMCVRCHEARTDRALSRSRFDVDALAALPRAELDEAIRRVTLPRTSPALMPPLRAGELPPWALARVVSRLTSYAAKP